MSDMNIKRSSFAQRDEKAGKALKTILRSAYEQTGFNEVLKRKQKIYDFFE